MFQVYLYNESVIQGGAHANLVDLFEEVAANSDNSVTITISHMLFLSDRFSCYVPMCVLLHCLGNTLCHIFLI